MESNERFEAQGALDAIGRTRSDLADRMVTPWFYYPALGLMLGAMTLVLGMERFHDSSLRFLLALLVIFGSLALATFYERKVGVSIGKPTGRRSTVVLALLSAGLLLPIVWTIIVEPTDAEAFLVAVFVFVFTVVGGRGYDAALRTDLRAGTR